MKFEEFKKISDYEWELGIGYNRQMNVPVRIFATREIIESSLKDRSIEQAVNSATLPGLKKYICVMPDVHQGYGFPIGGVAAFDFQSGVISPGGIGYDINCGVRLMSTQILLETAKSIMGELVSLLYQNCPSGLGKGKSIKISRKELEKICLDGSKWALAHHYAQNSDIELTEDGGRIEGADPESVNPKAMDRGMDQMGSLGSGNHFIEIDIVEDIYDSQAADRMGLYKNCLTLQIHCGSRGLGHQICTDFVKEFQFVTKKYHIQIPDRELVCAPVQSPEGKRYLSAMACAANFAFCNRQLLAFQARNVFEMVFKNLTSNFHLGMVYDLAHNIGKIENHYIDGKKEKLCIHRKGATRAFGPGNKDIPEKYSDIGQPVLIPGSMGTASWVMLGTQKAMEKSFGSCSHGAGRVLSRSQAKKQIWGENLKTELEKKGIVIIAGSLAGLAEEAPSAYKDVDVVIESVVGSGIASKVAKLKPVAVIKG